MIDIELFSNVSDRNTHSVQPLDRLIKRATTSEKLKHNTYAYRQYLLNNPNAAKQEKSKEKVKRFPAVTFAGTFTGTGKANDIKKMSGLIVLDIDHITDLKEALNQIQQDNHTYIVFTSPSGDGLKVIIKHNLKDPTQWKYLYMELESYYKQRFNIDTDQSGKDISRMCFLPYIENLYINNESKEWLYTGIPQAEAKHPQRQKLSPITTPNKGNEANEGNEDIETTEALYKQCFYLSAYLFENNINITETYEDWVLYIILPKTWTAS